MRETGQESNVLFKLDCDPCQRVCLLLDHTANNKIPELVEVLHASFVIDLHPDVQAFSTVALVFAFSYPIRPGANRHGKEVDYIAECELKIGGFILLGYDYKVFFVLFKKVDKCTGPG